MPHDSHEIILRDSVWWVASRGHTWGPFDYQWSSDLRGVEFLFQGTKFGEVCSEEEFFADLEPFGLPISVCRVAAIVAGSLATSLSTVEAVELRVARLKTTLDEFGFGRFRVRQVVETSENDPD